jgi:hypothetical protein
MTDEELQAIEARAAAATAGPWKPAEDLYCGEGTGYRPGGWRVDMRKRPLTEYIWVTSLFQSDAEFIASARTDVPALLKEVKRLRDLLDVEVEIHGQTTAHHSAALASNKRLRARLNGQTNG